MIENCTGIVIRQKQWGENDLLLSILTKEGFRKDLIAKGAGNGRSKRKSHLELMNIVHGTVYKSRTHEYLQSVECLNSHYHLKKNLERILEAELLIEVIEQSLPPEDAYPSAYELLAEVLCHLNEENPCKLGAKIGLVKWGQLLGILPNFKHCGTCHEALNCVARWNDDKQVLLCEKCGDAHGEELELKYRKALEFFKNASLHECRHLVFQDEELVKLDELIPYFFRHHLTRPLRVHKTIPIQTREFTTA